MSDVTLQISLDKVTALAVEYWRLSAAIGPALGGGGGGGGGGGAAMPVRHALRKIEDFLKSCDVEVRGLDGQPYDAGLAARVIDTVDDPALAKGTAVVTETLSPMILYRETVVRPADVVIARNPG
jgi:hypothetical protein